MTLTGAYVKKWRKSRKMSARKLGLALGYKGRELVRKIESGALPMSENFVTEFEKFKHETQTEEHKLHKIETSFPLPGRIKILAKPRRCSVCGDWFIFPSPNQKTCNNPDCKRAHAAKQRKARTRARAKRR